MDINIFNDLLVLDNFQLQTHAFMTCCLPSSQHVPPPSRHTLSAAIFPQCTINSIKPFTIALTTLFPPPPPRFSENDTNMILFGNAIYSLHLYPLYTEINYSLQKRNPVFSIGNHTVSSSNWTRKPVWLLINNINSRGEVSEDLSWSHFLHPRKVFSKFPYKSRVIVLLDIIGFTIVFQQIIIQNYDM